MCFFCKNNRVIETTTTHIVDFNDCVIVIKNVPCKQCEICGEKYYSDDITAALEKIVNAAKSLVQEVAVIDFKHAA